VPRWLALATGKTVAPGTRRGVVDRGHGAL